MLRTMVTATNTLGQLQTQLDTISNNIANSNTVGYKAQQAKFQELLYQQYNNDKLDKTLRQSPVGIRYGVGAHITQIASNEKQGSLQSTGRDLDFAMTTPNMYFNVLMPDGDNIKEVYTRQGNFYVSPIEEGTLMLVTSEGYPVADANGEPITLPDGITNFTMSPQGRLNAAYPDGQVISIDLGVTEIHKVQVMEKINGGAYIAAPENLQELGYIEADIFTNLNGANRTRISMQNGYLEQSNVDLSREMTDMIATQRSYQFNSRAVTIADQMLGLINGIR
ncbi:MAG: flagellar hook-basal body protein [Lysinibacillus sp.]